MGAHLKATQNFLHSSQCDVFQLHQQKTGHYCMPTDTRWANIIRQPKPLYEACSATYPNPRSRRQDTTVCQQNLQATRSTAVQSVSGWCCGTLFQDGNAMATRPKCTQEYRSPHIVHPARNTTSHKHASHTTRDSNQPQKQMHAHTAPNQKARTMHLCITWMSRARAANSKQHTPKPIAARPCSNMPLPEEIKSEAAG